MPSADVELYRHHQVWELLGLKSEALRTSRFGNANIETMRITIQRMLEYALRSRDNAQQGFLYSRLLSELQNLINGIPSDENQFNNWASNYLQHLESLVRQLPGPPPRNMPHAYVQQLDEAVRVREEEIAALRDEIVALREELTQQESAIETHGQTVSRQEEAVTEARQQIEAVAT